MLSGYQREVVLRLADRLCLELGYGGVPSGEANGDAARRRALVGELSREDEVLAASLRRALAELAAAVRNGAGGEERPRAAGTALEASELVIRGELLNGNSADVPELLPNFVFLVTLPTVGQDGALELSTRTGRLVDEALAG